MLQAGVSWVANAELAAAVSNSGALGIIAPNAGMPLRGNIVENLRAQIAKAKMLSNEPFGVHLPISAPSANELVDVIIGEEVPVVVTSAGNPAFYTSRFKDADIKVLHVVTSVREARAAEAMGVDAVIAQGYEAIGLLGVDELPALVLVPAVAEAVEIPIVASGGIVDGRGLVTALALGAGGVHMGTRFIATTECAAHAAFKEAIVKAVDSSTVVAGHPKRPMRMLKGAVATKLLVMRSQGASEQKFTDFLGKDRVRAALLEGDLVKGEPICGAGAGLISEVLPAGEVVRMIMKQAEEILARLK